MFGFKIFSVKILQGCPFNVGKIDELQRTRKRDRPDETYLPRLVGCSMKEARKVLQKERRG